MISVSVPRVRAAVVQMTSTADVGRNLDTAERLVEEAAARGARFVSLPENFAFLRSEGEPVPEAQALDGAWVSRLAQLARGHALTLFTERTGKDHWEVLLRARAIENLAYVVAPAQGGYHVNGRETHGHTMIVDPWGVVLDRLPRGSGVVVAGVNPTYQAKIRKSLPALTHKTVRSW